MKRQIVKREDRKEIEREDYETIWALFSDCYWGEGEDEAKSFFCREWWRRWWVVFTQNVFSLLNPPIKTCHVDWSRLIE